MTTNFDTTSGSKSTLATGTLSVGDQDLYVGPATGDQDIDGLELSDAARALGISVDEIWRRIRNGRLMARTMRGKVLVYTDMSEFLSTEGLPPPPLAVSAPTTTTVATINYTNSAVPIVYERNDNVHSQELALLIDHLSLAKDENREILKLTQDSMNRLTQMTDAILEMKDAMLAAKDEQLKNLHSSLENQAAELVKILKEKEDLETLTQTLLSK